MLTCGDSIELPHMKQMSEAMAHRGPDDLGYLGWGRATGITSGRNIRQLDSPTAVLIHRRLSIIDLSDAGAQPMSTPGGQLHIAYNGEVYNYVELRDELKQLGVKFHSHSDTEVVLKAYAQWGQDAFKKMVGMFALAIIDLRRKEILLARDFFGIKPLFYSHRDGQLAWGSEVQTLLSLPSLGRQLNKQRYFDYLRFARTDGDSQTLFDDIKQLMPGHVAVFDLETTACRSLDRFWKLSPKPRTDLTRKQAAELVREEFLNNVRLHLRSDVPVGTCLSGGIDSSAIVMAVRHILGKDAEIHSFGYIPDDEALSEEKYIDLVSRSAGTISHKIRPDLHDLPSDIDHLVHNQGEPFNGLSIYAQYRVFQKAHEVGIKVMLDGQGADELLGGYQGISRMTRLASMVRHGQPLRAMFFAMRLALLRRDIPIQTLIKQGLLQVQQSLPRRVCPRKTPGTRPAWIDSDWVQSHSLQSSHRLDIDVDYPRDVLRTYLHQAVETTSLPHLLRYEDRNSMAFSIESRVPFLTPQFAELMLSLPEEFLVDRNGVAKSIFRQAMRGLVPDVILDRKDKIGFTTPMENWLKGIHEWVSQKLASPTAHALPGINLPWIEDRWNRVIDGQAAFNPFIWRVLNMICWVDIAQPEWAE
jgi:asparagine synthase (glutamine-hydrolysing)